MYLILYASIDSILLICYLLFAFYVTRHGDYYKIRLWKAAIWLSLLSAIVFAGFLSQTWRPVDLEELTALVELAGVCHLADGGLAFMTGPRHLQSRYFPDTLGTAIGTFAPDKRLTACASVLIASDPE